MRKWLIVLVGLAAWLVRLVLNDDAPYVDDEVRARLGGDYAGFMISTSTGRYVAGAFLVRGLMFEDKYKHLLWLGPAKTSLTLPPGRRVRLVADKPSTLALRIAAGARRSIALRTSGPAGDISAQRLDLRALGTAGGVPVARGTTTVRVRKNQWLLTAFEEDRDRVRPGGTHLRVAWRTVPADLRRHGLVRWLRFGSGGHHLHRVVGAGRAGRGVL